MNQPIIIGGAHLERAIRFAWGSFPEWFTAAAGISEIIVSREQRVLEAIAMYEHGSRRLFVSDRIGSLLQKALGHELGHAIDDNFGAPHFFSSTPEWQKIHRHATKFDLKSHAEQPLEYFADMVTKMFIVGPQRLSVTHPNETTFLATWVFPVLQREF